MERVTGLEPATVCLEGRHSSQLSYTRIPTRTENLYIFPLDFQEKLIIWAWLGSNQRPIGYEPTALTTELCPRKDKYSISGLKRLSDRIRAQDHKKGLAFFENMI